MTAPGLTERELTVLRHVADGLTNDQIAKAMYLSPNTVRAHLRRLLFKLTARNRAHAVPLGVRAGLIPVGAR